jgi:hypothetical protein
MIIRGGSYANLCGKHLVLFIPYRECRKNLGHLIMILTRKHELRALVREGDCGCDG